jgi:pyrimidine-specific ribonucleoside hydrolase
VAVFLTNPELFTIEPLKDNNNICYNTNYAHNAVKEVLKDIITGEYKAGEYVALYGFPVKRELYTYDVRLIMDSAITRYGLDEWKACVLTDEFHGHLGVFSIVGAKMGMRARDFFGIGTDLLEVVSYAGTKPPFSCMNDGIQVSTGATLGQGTIKVESHTISKPTAIFTYKGQSIKITLNPEYLAQVKADIHKGITQFGLADENYWSLIRQNALIYWMEWDRNKIFEVEIVKTVFLPN